MFLDIDRLRAGKFDENLLMNIKLAKHFLLVLTNNALDRCVGDVDRQDWVHKVWKDRQVSTKWLCKSFVLTHCVLVTRYHWLAA